MSEKILPTSTKRAEFRYLPISGPLPGVSFEYQTAAAINELWNSTGNVDVDLTEIRRIAEEASATAVDASNTANEAAQIAQNALSRVQVALDTAMNAQNTANDALTLAQSIQANVSIIQSQLTIIQNNIDDVNNRVDSIETNLTNIQNTVAQLQAQVEFLSQYTVVEEAIDLNDYITLNRTFVAALDSLNLPIAEEGYLDVDITTNIQPAEEVDEYYYVKQKYQTLESVTYFRVAQVDAETNIATWQPWREKNAGNSESQNVLDAITVTASGLDLNNAFNISGRYYAANINIDNLPQPVEGLIELITDSKANHTLQLYSGRDGKNFQRLSSSTVTINDNTSTYNITFTSGTFTTTASATVYVINGRSTIIITSQYLTITKGGTTSGVTLNPTLQFWAPGSADIDITTNGYSLEISPTPGSGTGSVSVVVASDGTETVSSNDAEVTGISSVKYLSSEVDETANHVVDFQLAATWLDFTGEITWTSWQYTNPEVFDTEGRLTFPDGSKLWIEEN